jgi:hypothetical protein
MPGASMPTREPMFDLSMTTRQEISDRRCSRKPDLHRDAVLRCRAPAEILADR